MAGDVAKGNIRIGNVNRTIGVETARVYQQVVVTRIMPLGNTTGMTDEERAVIAAWVRAGAKPE